MKRPKLMLALAFLMGVLVGIGLMYPMKAINVRVDLPPAVAATRP